MAEKGERMNSTSSGFIGRLCRNVPVEGGEEAMTEEERIPLRDWLVNPVEVEKGAATMQAVAAILRSYFEALVQEGFGCDEAMMLVVGWQAMLVQGARRD